jgi:hypothetical protein
MQGMEYLKKTALQLLQNTYADESKIIRNVGTCFAVGYTVGWA